MCTVSAEIDFQVNLSNEHTQSPDKNQSLCARFALRTWQIGVFLLLLATDIPKEEGRSATCK